MRPSKTWTGAVLTLLATLIFPGCSPQAAATSSPPALEGQTASPLALATAPWRADDSLVKEGIVGQLNDFSRRLYTQAAPSQKGNLAISPLGSFVLLDLLYEGSAGAAHEEIAKTTGFTPASLAEIATMLDGLQSDQLSIAQRIFFDDKRAKLVEAYLKKVDKLLNEPVLAVPFGSDPDRAVSIINTWVEERTKGLIKNFLPPLPPLTVSVLASVLHYKGSWAFPFPKGATAPADFASPGGPIKVSMMRLSSKDLALFEVPGGQAVVLPHADNTEMMLILPEEGRTPNEILESLSTDNFRGRRPSGDDVLVELPRFEFEVDTFELTPAWKALDLEATTTEADVSPMLVLEPPAPVELIVYHKTYVKVNEEGTEAAAATAVVMVPKGARAPTEPKVIRFDRPFAFVLRDSTSGAVLMMGRVEQPTPADS